MIELFTITIKYEGSMSWSANSIVSDILTKILWSQQSIHVFTHTRPEQSWYFLNYILGSDGTQVTRANVGTTLNVRSNHRSQVFWENQFFVFWGAPKNFFEPKKPYLALETPLFGGVILLKLFDPSFGFGATCGKIAIFWHIRPWKSPKL